MIKEYLATCKIENHAVQTAIKKYDPYCIIVDRNSLMNPVPYGFADWTFGFDIYEYGFWNEEYRK